MAILVKLIADYSLWLYLILAIIAVILLRVMSLALRERSRSIFGLERENATTRFGRAAVYLVVVLFLAGGVFYVSTSLIEQVPLPEVTPTATVVVELPPTPTPPPLLPTPTLTLTPTPRPTQAIAAENTPTPETPPPSQGTQPNCPNLAARITQPNSGATVSGVIEIQGAAAIDDFDYYKIEFLAPGGDWNFIESYENPVLNGFLGSWNTDTVPPGQYGFRLVVVNNTGNYPEPCQITLNIQP